MYKIISVHSFRGGTGKSNMTANLAASLVLQGKRVAIIDTDIQSPGVHVLFGLDEDTMGLTLNDYIYGRCTIVDAALDVTAQIAQTKTLKPDSALYLIPSSIKAVEIAQIVREGYEYNALNDGFQELMDELRLDYLLLDTHPGLSDETLLSIAVSNVLVLMLRPDHQDFQGTAVTVEVARKLEVENLLLVLNKVHPAMDFESLRQEVEQTYQAPVAAILALSEDMVMLASKGLFSLHYPDHPYSQGVRKVAAQVMQLI